MSVEFHCNHCGRKIRAPDEAGGRRGKCPFCHNSVYIPSPADQLDEIPLAPVDEAEERRRAQLEEERKQIDANLRAERASAADKDNGPSGRRSVGAGEIEELIVEYLLRMRNSELVQAEEVLAQLLRNREATREAVDRMAMDGMPPDDLSEVPPAVYQGFLKNLRSQL